MHYSITTVSGRKRKKVKYETKKVINVYTEHIRVTYRKELHAGNIYRIEGIGKKLPLRRLQPGEALPILRIANVSLDARMNWTSE